MAKGSCLLFLGPELGEKQDAIDDVRKRMGAGREETSFYAGETSVSMIASFVLNGSLFADTRLILIKNADVIKKKDEIELLAPCMKAPPNDTTLILVSDAASLAKALETAVPASGKKVFWELFENKKQDWLVSFFRRAGFRIGEDGIEAILELVENNTGALRQECTRLMRFLSKDKPISADDVEKWLSHTREESAFTLFSRIAAGDFQKSLETLHALLLAKEPPIAIMAGLSWCFRKLRDYTALMQSGNVNDFEFKKIGLASSKVRKDYESAFRRYGPAAPDVCLSLTAEFDTRLRQGGADLDDILMDLYLYKLCFQRC
ncbi:MAG: DNA polymerase III subunit delta [Treponema sp.]|jgi:DNA polymerase-3 subunit delta|nr:DNA polymerase III subunit delta [Treponema sp.]